MIKRVKQSKVASVVAVLCGFIIVAYVYTNLHTLLKPRKLQLYDFPKNYVYKKKNLSLPYQKIPALQQTNFTFITVNQSQSYREVEYNFFRYLQHKDVICDDDIRHGNQHDGGWNVCMSPPFTLRNSCLVYSFGIGDDWRFEDDVHDRYGCTVLAFDPSIPLIEHNRTDKIRFKPIGLGARNRISKEKWHLKTLKQLLKDEDHSETIIDYLKFDIEYMEWNVLVNMIKDASLANVKQLAFEIHLRSPHTRAPKDYLPSRNDLIRKYRILNLLEDDRFWKFNFRLNPFCEYKSPKTFKKHSYCYELCYLNTRFVEGKYLKPS